MRTEDREELTADSLRLAAQRDEDATMNDERGTTQAAPDLLGD
jgi:hypothetical protein